MASRSADADGPPVPAFTAQLVPHPPDISRLIGAVAAFLEDHGVDPRATNHCGLILDELLTNIADHGSEDRLQCDIGIAIEPNRIGIVIADRADPFDPRGGGEPDLTSDLADRQVGGLGLYLVRRLAQDMDYVSDARGNLTSLFVARHS